MDKPGDILRQYWGFTHFRPLQAEVIEEVMHGHDTLAVMPTGAGKSLCYQIPALLKDGICLVITPLIALMKDQVEQLSSKGIPALAVHAGMHGREVEKTFKNALYGNFKLLYLSPERLQTSLFLDYVEDLPVSLLAVDEAHCISQWGHDFRPAYRLIGALRATLPQVTVLAVTATATRRVREDIQQQLGFGAPRVLMTSFFREALSYSVSCTSGKLQRTIQILEKVPGAGLIFCRSRKRCAEVATRLADQGISADFYHAGLSAEIRSQKQEAWQNGKTRIMVCTSAFGMGIDKPDVRTVIHYDLTDTPESYYQEAGRAGRDGLRAYGILLYAPGEPAIMERLLAQRYPSITRIREVYRAIVSYLNLPAGAGEGCYFDFDLTHFTQIFRLDPWLARRVLHLLEQEEILSFQENASFPARICFTVTRRELQRFTTQQPQFDTMIQGLLRAYGGIVHNYVPVNEHQIARQLSLKAAQVTSQWRALQGLGLLDYQPRRDTPQLYFFQPRLVVERLQIHTERIRQREESDREALQALLAYAQNDTECRSRALLGYFGEEDSLPCGICDICLQQKRSWREGEGHTALSDAILGRLAEHPHTWKELADFLPQYGSLDIGIMLRLLSEAGKVRPAPNDHWQTGGLPG